MSDYEDITYKSHRYKNKYGFHNFNTNSDTPLNTRYDNFDKNKSYPVKIYENKPYKWINKYKIDNCISPCTNSSSSVEQVIAPIFPYSNINSSYNIYEVNNVNPYKKLDDIKNIYGFVVNIQDVLNFDIDFNQGEEYNNHIGTNNAGETNIFLHNYKSVHLHKKMYEYVEYKENFEETWTKKGYTYRCHLRGIDIIGRKTKEEKTEREKKIIFSAKNDIDKLIKNNNRWVVCNLGDIDIYNRILIDLFIITEQGHKINLANHLIDTYPSIYTEYNTSITKEVPIFYRKN